MKPLTYRALELTGGKAPMYFTYRGGRHPLVCLRSLLAALGLGWRRWSTLCIRVCQLHSLFLHPAQGPAGRPTYLLGLRQVPRFLATLAPQVSATYPAGGSRLAALAVQWTVRYLDAAATKKNTAAVNGPSDAEHASASPEPPKPSSASISLARKKTATTITREVESHVLALAAQGEGCGAIARRVGISKAAASLLMNGKYKFAAEQAVRPRLAEDVPMLHARTGKPAKVTADTGRQVLALCTQGYAQAEVARRLGLSKATVNLLVHGKYQFARGA